MTYFSKWFQMMSVMVFAVVFTSGCATTDKRDMASQLAVAKTTIAGAVNSGAPEFAPADLENAQRNMAAAEKAAKSHDYKRARTLAESAEANAQLASAKARAAKAQQAADALREGDDALQQEMDRKLQ